VKPVIDLEGAQVFAGDCAEVLKSLPDNSVDSIVTDPPYGLSNTSSDLVSRALVRWVSGERDFIPDGKGFMGKDWDAFVPPPAVWDECLRVLKPGGHLLAFFGSRTMDLGQLAIRLSGFEIRDNIAWMYGSGFPKSLDVSKAIDKAAGSKREVIGKKSRHIGRASWGIDDGGWQDASKADENGVRTFDLTAPSTPEAQQWQGWGTALKPAFEPIVVARKPIEGTVAANVLEWGTGGLNIDGSRIGTETRENSPASYAQDSATRGKSNGGHSGGFNYSSEAQATTVTGRWPANVILDDYSAQLLEQQSGKKSSTRTELTSKPGDIYGSGTGLPAHTGIYGYDDFGGASRFFYTAKASKRDRNEGLDDLEAQRHADRVADDGVGGDNPRNRTNQAKRNFHPTVKPTALMRYLVKLVTPPGGTVLDPFTGSGSTGKAALLQGFNFIGVEFTDDYFPIIQGRLEWALENQEDTLF